PHVSYTDNVNPRFGFVLTCADFFKRSTIKGTSLEVSGLPQFRREVLHPLENGTGIAAIYQGIRDACAAQQAEINRQVEFQTEERGKRIQAAAIELEAAAIKKKTDFRDGILAALRAAEDPDPFSSIRGDFDLAAAD